MLKHFFVFGAPSPFGGTAPDLLTITVGLEETANKIMFALFSFSSRDFLVRDED